MIYDSFAECVGQILKLDDPKKSVRILFEFMKQIVPLDFLTILQYNPESHSGYDLIHVTDQDALFVDDSLQFSQTDIDDAMAIMSNEANTYIADSMAHPLIRKFNDHVGIIETASVIIQPCRLTSGTYAVLNLVLWETGGYTPQNQLTIQNISDQLTFVLEHIYSHIDGSKKHRAIQTKSAENSLDKEIVGKQGGMKDTMVFVDMVARLDTPVFLLGESGVGKDLIATKIHEKSKRTKNPFICINCGAIPESLIDSELFGHEKGAFTGATESKKGYFEMADKGTIFLDEISELSRSAQVKLLRVLQNKSFRRVGGENSKSVDTRVIAASNRDLEKMVQTKTFRKDLWFRLNTFPIKIPPLRNRKQDIIPLAKHFAKLISLKLLLPYKYRFSVNAMDQLLHHDWPGNVRELKNTIEYAMIISRGKPISFEFLYAEKQAESSGHLPENEKKYLPLDEIITNHIKAVLIHTNGRVEGRGGAAEILDLKPSTLRAKIRKLNIRVIKSFKAEKYKD